MKKEELEEDINFVMANLDEVLNDKKGLYDDIVDYDNKKIVINTSIFENDKK